MHTKPHTKESKAKIIAKINAWKKTPEYKLHVEKQRERGKKSPTQFKKGHKPLTDGKNLKGLQAGKTHWNWKGGITEESHTLRNSSKYKIWRDFIFRRDDFICQLCGARGCSLEADHYPIPWCVIFQEKNWTLMWDTNNGRTLCKVCHNGTKLHWKKYYAKS